MSDLVKASDLGIETHISSQVNSETFKSFFFDPINEKQLIDKIDRFGSSVTERDAILEKFLPKLPNNFKIQPDIKVSLPRSALLNVPKAFKNNEITNSQAVDVNKTQLILDQAEMITQKANNLQELQDSVAQFDTGMVCQNIAHHTLFYKGADKIDILWIGDAVSEHEDLNNDLMSDIKGKMVLSTLKILGYEIDAIKASNRIGFTNLLFWPEPLGSKISLEGWSVGYPFIKKLIGFVKPQKIIISGKNALKILCDQDKFMEKHGHSVTINFDASIKKAFVIFSPQQLLISSYAKKIFWFDLLRIMLNEE